MFIETVEKRIKPCKGGICVGLLGKTMPIFKLEDTTLDIAQRTDLELETHLETWLENSPWAVIQDELVLWIDRQASAQDKEGTIYPDLLGVDSEGNLVIVEKDKPESVG